jgi:uncharacterized protein (TIGR03790 family)
VLKFAFILVPTALAFCQSAENVLVVVNQASPLSQEIADYYALRRHIPVANVCRIGIQPDEEISHDEYQSRIGDPVAAFLRSHQLEEKILYIVTTAGLPLRVRGHGAALLSEIASVDSELALLYSDMHGRPHSAPSGIPNPFFGKVNAPFRHPDFPIYLVTRLAGYDLADAKGIIDRALQARNRGMFVVDLRGSDKTDGNKWLLQAAAQLPKQRVVLDQSSNVLYNQSDVIAYASWGSNDPDRKQRHLGFHWLPGAILTEYVSTNARTFVRPPENWNFSAPFGGTSQSLTADYIHDGVTGASGHVAEPFLPYTPRPDIVLPAYYRGRTLAESFYLSIRSLSWMNIVIGDPLCTLGKP